MESSATSKSSAITDCFEIQRIRSYAWYYTVAWTFLLIASAILTTNEYKETILKLALVEARTTINRDFIYRHWISSYGGVYAPASEKNLPDSHLSNLPERDVLTDSGRKLTLIDATQMTRQVYELAKETNIFIATGHLTSLKPTRPEHTPDPWEKESLFYFNKGGRETSKMVKINNEPFMRLMVAFIAEKSCLKCHLDTDIKEGDLLGGLSIQIPAQPLIDASHRQIFGSLVTHAIIWLLGLCINVIGARKLVSNTRIQKQTESQLHEQAHILEEEIAERQSTQESLESSEEKLKEQNYELQATDEMLRVQLAENETSQMQLKESNKNLQAIFDVSPLPIIISSFEDGIIREMNQTFSSVFGYQRDQVIGKKSIEVGIWSDTYERSQFIQALKGQEALSDFPTEIKNSSGEVRSVVLYSTATDYKNEPCLLIVFMDVTEQKRTLDELRQAQKMDVVGQLAGGVAHDFNNMLTAIIGSTEMMERYVKDNPAAAKLLKTINEAAGRSADLTAQLLSFSRKGNKMTLQVSINKTILTVIEMLEHSIDKNIRLEKRLTPEHDMVIGDPTQLQNALLNLGLNARDAMPNGGTIKFTTAIVFLDAAYSLSHGYFVQPGHYIEISVSDTGSGIPHEIINHIFEPFFTTKGIGKGTGLGLASVYGTVKEHQGSINVQSEPDLGTIFKLYLPMATGQRGTDIKLESTSKSTGGILLVDDEQLIREMGKALLEDHGYDVHLAANGEQALEVYDRERENVSLVILDVVMPVMGGKETLERLIEKYSDVKVLISSGFHQDENDDSFKKLGAVGFIQKPYRTQELYKAVDNAIHNSKYSVVSG